MGLCALGLMPTTACAGGTPAGQAAATGQAATAMPLALGASKTAPRLSMGKLVVFGDSLSDYGNNGVATNIATAGRPSGTWAMQLARSLGLDLSVSRQGGTNYARCWATSAELEGQVDAYLKSAADSAVTLSPGGNGRGDTLFAVWIGGNDLLVKRSQEDARAAVEQCRRQIARLYGAGGRNFIWLNMPDLGRAPLVAHLMDATAATQAAQWYNQYWEEAVRRLQAGNPDMVLVPLDVSRLLARVVREPARYGIKNVAYGCAGIPNARAEEFLFWDGLHPTTRGHELVAQLALSRLEEAFAGAPKTNRPGP